MYYPSTLSSWTMVIANAAEAAGVDYKQIFSQAGVDIEKFNDPNARFSYDVMIKLWNSLAVEINDPCFGLKVAEYIRPTTFHALGYAWYASTTLKEALERLVRYIRLLNVNVDAGINYKQDECRLNIWVKEGLPTPPLQAQDASMATIIKLCRVSYGDNFNPKRLLLGRPRPHCEQGFDEYFQAPIKYSSSENIIIFDLALLEKPLPTANAELALASDRIIMQHLAELDKDDIATKVKLKLIDSMVSGNTNESSIANLLHMSPRTLQRKLDQAGTSYKKLFDDTRRTLASKYVKHSSLSISEITYLLGFTEPSNFSRAYKRWNGVTPSEQRLAG